MALAGLILAEELAVETSIGGRTLSTPLLSKLCLTLSSVSCFLLNSSLLLLFLCSVSCFSVFRSSLIFLPPSLTLFFFLLPLCFLCPSPLLFQSSTLFFLPYSFLFCVAFGLFMTVPLFSRSLLLF